MTFITRIFNVVGIGTYVFKLKCYNFEFLFSNSLFILLQVRTFPLSRLVAKNGKVLLNISQKSVR